MRQLLITIAAVVLVGCGFGVNKPLVVSVDSVAGAKAPDISIHDAVEKGNIEAVKYHLTAGTKVDLRDDGHTPLDVAFTSQSLLRKHGGKTGEELKAEGK